MSCEKKGVPDKALSNAAKIENKSDPKLKTSGKPHNSLLDSTNQMFIVMGQERVMCFTMVMLDTDTGPILIHGDELCTENHFRIANHNTSVRAAGDQNILVEWVFRKLFVLDQHIFSILLGVVLTRTKTAPIGSEFIYKHTKKFERITRIVMFHRRSTISIMSLSTRQEIVHFHKAAIDMTSDIHVVLPGPKKSQHD